MELCPWLADSGCGVRYPFAVLEEYLGDRDVARALKISGRYLDRARSEGLSVEQADRYAIRLGLHPSCLWPSWFYDAEDEFRDAERLILWWERIDRYRCETSVEHANHQVKGMKSRPLPASLHNGITTQPPREEVA